MGLINGIPFRMNLTVQFHELLEGAEGSAAVDALAGNGDALLDALLSLLQHLDAEGGVGQHDVLLGGQGTVLEYGVEDLCGLFLGGTAHEFLGLGNVEAEVLGREDALVVLGGDLEVARQRDLVVAVDGVHDAVVDANLLIHLIVEAHLVEVGHTQQLALGLTGVDQRTQQVEDGGELQRLADGTDELHGLGEELGVQIDDACLVERAVQLVDVVGELDAVMGNDVRGTADAGGSIVAVLGHLIAGTGDDEAAGGRDIKGVLAVAASADHVDVAVGIEDGGHARLQDAVAEAQQLVNGDAAHLQGR